jgi:hypothetical protein
VISTVDDNVGTGGLMQPALAFDESGLPVLAYYGTEDGEGDFPGSPAGLRVVVCGRPRCDTGNEAVLVDPGINGLEPSLAISNTGLPVVAYGALEPNSALRVLSCGTKSCDGERTIVEIATSGFVRDVSLALSPDGSPVVAFFVSSPMHDADELTLLRCGNARCDSGNKVLILDHVALGESVAMTLDSEGNPVIVYAAERNSRLKLIRCPSPGCE